jgi:2-haloacid dehalogenase
MDGARWATFDCYGTLIDWEHGLGTTLSSLWPEANRDGLLARFHEMEPRFQVGPAMTYREVLGRSLAEVARAERLDLPFGAGGVLAESLPRWRAFPEVSRSLLDLRDRGWKLAILSNTDPDLLVASILQIGVEPDLTVTAREARSYKPAHGHWLVFRELTGADPGRHVHVAASPFHDLAPCAELGIPAVWINRNGDSSDHPRAAELPDLFGLPDALDGLVAP